MTVAYDEYNIIVKSKDMAKEDIMPYCSKCGAQVRENGLFCEACGAKQERKQNQSVIPPHSLPTKTEPIARAVEEPYVRSSVTQQSSRVKTNWGIFAIIGVLLAGLIVIGVLYGIGTSNLNKAKADIVDLEGNVATLQTNLAAELANVNSLQTQLASEQANVTSLQTQLAEEEANVASLQTQLTTATNDLNSSKAQVTQLQSDLNTSNLQVTNLQTQLTNSIANVARLQADLDTANADLASAIATNTSLTGELTKVTYPRHFNSLDELETWLANDDTDTIYADESGFNRAYILQVRALRDGYILPVSVYYSGGSTFMAYNTALAGNTIYQVYSLNDSVVAYVNPSIVPPTYPLPLE
ncbi:MAG: hypothetical protein PHE15_05305 [Dehalococcoidales bacterium]|nr:hypothetical protein [Dehalococcoidales bacterium]